MSKLNIQQCPETGICSLIKASGEKVDLMPDEVNQLREAVADPQKIQAVLATIDPAFSAQLDDEELGQLSAELS